MFLLQSGLQQTVLFLDQASQIESLIRTGILTYPCQMAFCSGGRKEALQVIQRDPPDLLVTSMELSDGNAPELMRELHEKVGPIPSIFIANPGTIDPNKKVGAFDLLQRPFQIADLISKIDRAVHATRQFRQKTRLDSFVEYAKVHDESVSKGMLVSELLDLRRED